ncbi:MAG: hypothetical protein CM15mP120_24690 [Pseudomonadota bacterium]|nr:MAG: hypothetical protein CM15mP120_24690 [Pseudomonadota bacterium]
MTFSKRRSPRRFIRKFSTSLVDGQIQPAVIRDLQRNPANGRVQHIDFQRVSADKEINVNVPLHFINEAACVGVKMSGALSPIT